VKSVAKAVVEAGLVDDSVLGEMRRWGVPLPDAEAQESVLRNKDTVLLHIREAIESEDQVRMDETELDLLSRYLDKKNQLHGRLILKEGKKHQTTNVSFCLTTLGEYAIPWTDDDEPEILVNGETHLKWEDEEGKHDVHFSSYRSVYFGNRKAFVVCEGTNV
jgi:hypothetical protein